MRQFYSLFVAAIALAVVGCSVEPFSKEEGNEITIKATMAENNPTKTVIQDGTSTVLWEPADEVKVFYKTTGSRFTSNNTEPAGTADFTGNLTITGFFGEGFTADTPLWAVYPYRADATSDGESVTTTLPSTQTGRAGSFAKSTNITLAKSSNTTMGFYNVCGGIRFSLTQEGINEVIFEGQNDEDIAGKVKLVFVDGLPSVQEVIEGQKTITLSAPYGQTFETGKWYYIVALPGTLSGGFKMTFNTVTQYATLTSSASRTIKRGIFGSIANADEDLTFTDKEGGDPQTGNIVFADVAAKYACVAKYDTNGDGEVSIEEAEAATSFDGLFTDWKGIASFDEIRYFKNVHSLSGVFNGCNKLVSITIPENITDLGTSAFSGCTLLSSLVLPSGITAIGNYTFQNCSSLSSIDIPASVTSVGQYAFSGCSSLTAADLPSGVTVIANYTFQNCSSLVAVGIPSNVTSIGQYAFSGCSSLSQVVIPEGVTSIPQYCFHNCSSLTSVTVPTGITTVEDNAFSGVNMWKLELPSSITSLGGACFGSITCIILPSTSPVSIQSTTFDGVKGIFVPSSLIGIYGVMTNWADCASKIRPIDTFREKNEFTLATSGAVDMGTSVKWAAFNLGATRPEEYGQYYTWGETQTKSNYNWTTYRWCNGRETMLTKYCPEDKTDYWDGEGAPDSKTVLDLEDDAARANWGDTWRMPTNEEWTELTTDCMWEWTTYEGINGYMVYCIENCNSIFLPAAGSRSDTYLYFAGSKGNYWSCSLDSVFPNRAWLVFFDSGSVGRSGGTRPNGFSVRPVYGESPIIPVENVSLDKTEKELVVGETSILVATVTPSDATVKSVTWSSSNPSVASVSPSGVVTGISAGMATITVTTTDGGKTAICTVTVNENPVPPIPVPEAIDLGLSVKWASFNLGASAPEEFGEYYAWGETEPYYTSLDPLTWKPGKGCGYDWPAYKWCMGTGYTLTKYCGHTDFGYNEFTDYKSVLDIEDDAAYVNLGDKWRMPSGSEFDELKRECTWTWTTNNGIYGYLVTSNKPGYTDTSIFIPAAGKWIGTVLSMSNEMGYYWKTGCEPYFGYAWDLCIEHDGSSSMVENRCYGFSIRPVFGDPTILVKSISLDQTEIEIPVGGSVPLHATILPENATNKTLTWSSNNESAAIVSSSGVVTGVAPGRAVISVTADLGGAGTSCYVTVTAP